MKPSRRPLGLPRANGHPYPSLGKKKRSHTESRRHGEEEMNVNEIGGIVVDCAVKMPMRLGPAQVCWRVSMTQYCLMKDGISRIINGKLE